jgi:peroxin-16
MLQVPDSRANLVDWKDDSFNDNSWLPHLSYVLAIIRQCEIIMEMAVLKWNGDDARWKLLGTVESIKYGMIFNSRCVIKTIIFNHTQNRMLLGSSVLEPEPVIPSKDAASPAIIGDTTWVGKRTGIERPFSCAIQSKGINYLLNRAVAESSPMEMVKPLHGIRKAAEYLYILRPLIYLVLLRKCEKKSWKPWLISLGMEILTFLPSNGWSQKLLNYLY